MRRPMAKKVLAASMAAAMTMSVAACGETAAPAASTAEPAAEPAASVEEVAPAAEEEEVDKYTVLKDANGNVYDLGGLEITIRDWWSNDDPVEAKTDYEEAVQDYREWIQEKYNFKVHTVTMGDWASCGQDFVDYVSTGGDDNYYVWTVYSGNGTLLSAAQTGLCYDLSTLDCLDFNDKKYTDNNVHKLFSFDGGIYGMHAGPSEPRGGLYFNKRLLTEAGVNPDDIYDMQANDTWTWDAWEEILKQVQRDVDNDGTIDVRGLCCNNGVATAEAVFSNGGCYVSQDADGNFVNELNNPNTVEALEWILGIFQKYDWDGENEDGSVGAWDFYQGQFKNGGAAFLAEHQYAATPGQLFYDMEDELGFVMFPKGPHGKLMQTGQDNVYVIPGCYDAEKAWACAFAFDLWNEYIPGYEDFNPYINTTRTGNFDTRACEETVPLMGANSTVELQTIVPNNDKFMNEPFTYKIGPNTTETIAEILEVASPIADEYIAAANAK